MSVTAVLLDLTTTSVVPPECLCFLQVVHMNCSCGRHLKFGRVCFVAFRRSSARTLRRSLVVLTHLADCLDHATISHHHLDTAS